MASFVGAIAIADMVKTTLGPKGMDKILQSVRLVITCRLRMLLTCDAVDGRPRQEHLGHERWRHHSALGVRGQRCGQGTRGHCQDPGRGSGRRHHQVTNRLWHSQKGCLTILHSVAVLCGELLREAEKLIDQRIHPQTIIDGWRIALTTAYEALQNSARDNSSDPEKFREDLLNIARTTLSSKLLTQEKEHFGTLAALFCS